jgi:hypothetical protein
MRCLLDKNIVRHAIVGLRDGRQRPLTEWELGALSFWQIAQASNVELFISLASFQILHRMTQSSYVRVFLRDAQVLYPTKYHSRWSRRIRETTGLAREDAAIVALASFGTGELEAILGVKWLVTYDRPLINGYLNHLPKLERRLAAMKPQLQAPFNQVRLPLLGTPDEVQESLTNFPQPHGRGITNTIPT